LNASDKILNLVDTKRRNTLVASKVGQTYILDIHMQGPKETVFFDL
jgi:protocatechuate 3,4-dioxygenase alpha subunit